LNEQQHASLEPRCWVEHPKTFCNGTSQGMYFENIADILKKNLPELNEKNLELRTIQLDGK